MSFENSPSADQSEEDVVQKMQQDDHKAQENEVAGPPETDAGRSPESGDAPPPGYGSYSHQASPYGGYNPNTGWGYQQGYGGSYQSPYGSYGAGQPGPSSYGGPGRGPQGGGYAPQHKEPYQWRFEDYAEADRKQPQKEKRKSGAMIFALLLSGVVGLAILFSAGYGVYSWLQDNMDFPPLSSSHSASSEASGGTPELLIKDTRKKRRQSAEGRLTRGKWPVWPSRRVGISRKAASTLTAAGRLRHPHERGGLHPHHPIGEGAIAI
jgi:hypothetical protein